MDLFASKMFKDTFQLHLMKSIHILSLLKNFSSELWFCETSNLAKSIQFRININFTLKY